MQDNQKPTDENQQDNQEAVRFRQVESNTYDVKQPVQVPTPAEAPVAPVTINETQMSSAQTFVPPVTQATSRTSSVVSDTTSVAPGGVMADSSSVSQPAWPQEQKKPRKKGILYGVIAAAVAIVLGGSSYAAYALWYQNPEKVITDGLVSVLTAKTAKMGGSFSASIQDYKYTVNFTSQGGIEEGMKGSATLALESTSEIFPLKLKLEGDGIVAKGGDIYFKVKDLQKVYEETLDAIIDAQANLYKDSGMPITEREKQQVKDMYDAGIGSIVRKMGSKWIKISAEDMDEANKGWSESYKCMQNVWKKLSNDQKVIQEIGDVYMKNRFIIIKEQLGVKDGNVGYLVDFDKDKSKTFGEGMKQTTLYSDLKKCSKESVEQLDDVTKTNGSDGSDEFRLALWFNQFSHHFVKAEMSGETGAGSGDKTKYDIKVNYEINTPVSVDIPKDPVSLKKLIEELQSSYGLPATSVVPTGLTGSNI